MTHWTHTFVNGVCECGETSAPSYPDDVVAVMRDTITALRETIAAKNELITEMRTTLAEGAHTMALASAIIDADRARRAEKKAAP